MAVTPLSQNILPFPGSDPGPDETPPSVQIAMKPDTLARVGSDLLTKFKQYEWDRRMAELKWERNARQYLGVYDPDIESRMDINRNRAYPKLTRVKCVSMLSRLMNLLFPADDKNWTISPSAVPNLSQEDLQGILDSLSPAAPPDLGPPGMPASPLPPPPSDDQIEQAIRDFALKRADRMALEIEDQLQELGGAKSLDYVALCRRVIQSGVRYGCGVLKGPFVETQEQTRWEQDAQGKMQAMKVTAYRPRFEFVPLWEYYPDMSAKEFCQMDGQFQRNIFSKHQLVMLKQRPDFMPDQIDKAISQSPTGNYKRRAYETELLAMGPQLNTTYTARTKYEVYVWEGYISGRDLAECGATVSEAQLTQDVRAQVWILGDHVIKANIDPWSQLITDGKMPQYHHFIFEEDESFLLGNGLPNIVRDSQMGVCAAVRMALDNASIQRNIEINTTLLDKNQDVTAIQPDKIWYRNDDSPATLNVPAIRAVEFQSHIPEMQALVKMFSDFADQETFVNAATGGDMQKGPSEPFRTATGASMLRGDAALPFKDVVRNFDSFTESVIGSILQFNKVFNPDPNVAGDFMPIARGATSLIAKEVLGTQLDNFAQTLSDEEKQYLNVRELLRARVRVRDLQVEDIVMTDAQCDAVDQQNQQKQQQTEQQAQELAEAQVREILSTALKNIAQAGKNTAAGQADTANIVLAALEKGLNPTSIIPTPGAANDPNAASAPGAGAEQQGSPAGPGSDPGAALGGLAGVAPAPDASAGASPGFAAAMPAG